MNASRAILRPVLVSHARLRWDKIREQHQLLYPEGLLELNPSAAAVVRLLDGRTIPEIIEALGKEFEDEPEAEDIRELLQSLSERRLLRDAPDNA